MSLQTIEVPILETPPSVEDFVTNYLAPGKPVIIRGALESFWPAMSKWSLNWLKEHVGDTEVAARFHVDREEYKTGTKYDLATMKLKDYINRLQEDPTAAQEYYLAVQNLKRIMPTLVPDVPMLPYVGKLHMGPYMWIAPPGHFEFCHTDADDGLLCIIEGKKVVRLYSWIYLNNLYPNPLGHKGRTIQSQVNCDNPDLEAFPLFKDTICEMATLTRGDTLFIPAFYWHQVTSPEITISVNTFFGDAGESTFVDKMLTTRRDSFLHWIFNVVEQNRSTSAYDVILYHVDHMMKHFAFKQFHEQMTDEHCKIIAERVLEYCGVKRGEAKEVPIGKNTVMKIRGLKWRG